MSDDTSPTVAGAVLIAGAVAMIIGAAVPLVTDLGTEAWTADWDRKLDLIITNPTAWRVANGLIIVGAVITVVGIGLVANLLRVMGLTAEAAAAVALFPVAVAIEAVNRTANMTVAVWAAEAKAANDPLFRVFSGIDAWRALLGELFLLLATVALVVIGVGFWRIGQRTIAVSALGFGVLGLLSAAFADLIPATVFLGTGALGVVLMFSDRRLEA